MITISNNTSSWSSTLHPTLVHFTPAIPCGSHNSSDVQSVWINVSLDLQMRTDSGKDLFQVRQLGSGDASVPDDKPLPLPQPSAASPALVKLPKNKWAPKLLGRIIFKFCFSQGTQEQYGLSTVLDEVNKEMNFICALCLQVLFTTDSATTKKLTSLTIDFSVFKMAKVISVTHWHL